MLNLLPIILLRAVIIRKPNDIAKCPKKCRFELTLPNCSHLAKRQRCT